MSRRSTRIGHLQETDEGFPRKCPGPYCNKTCVNRRAYLAHMENSKTCAKAMKELAKSKRPDQDQSVSTRNATGRSVSFAVPLEDYSAPTEYADGSENGEEDLEEEEEDMVGAPVNDEAAVPENDLDISRKERNETFFSKPDDFDSSYLQRVFGEENRQDYHRDMYRNMNAERKSDLELLEITKGHSTTLFKKIRQWRYNSENRYKHRMDHDSYVKKERARIIQDIESDYNLGRCRPTTKRISLPNLKIQADLTMNSFLEQLMRLLSDPVLMDEANLAIDPKDPFKKPKLGGENGLLGELNTGTAFVDAYNRLCTQENDIIVAILLGLDKSHCDVKGKLTLEPLMWTLSIFNMETRRKPQAWCRLAHMPNLDHLAPRADATAKLRDYHVILRIMMEELIQFQRLGGIEWTLRLDNKDVDVRLQIPVMFCIGDTEGHDKLVGRKVERQSMTNNQCRCCDVSHVGCGNPYEQVNLTKAETIRSLRDDKKVHALDDLSYKLIECAFDDVVFADKERGIHGASPPETLHAVDAGLMDRTIEACYEKKRVKPPSKKKPPPKKKRKLSHGEPSARKRTATDEEEEEDEDGNEEDEEEDGEEDEDEEEEKEVVVDRDGDRQQVYVRPEEGDLGPRYIFGPKQCDFIDDMARQLHKQLRWQSDTSLPRTSFPQGICSLVKMTHNERAGVLLLLMLILCMDNMEYYYRTNKTKQSKNVRIPPSSAGHLIYTIKEDHFSSMAKYIGQVLMFESYLKMTQVPLDCIPYTKRLVRAMVSGLFDAFPRTTGTGYATIKTHLVTHHMVEDQLRFGSLANVSSESLESGHKYHIKKPGRTTQKRASSFSAQVGMQAHYNDVVERAYKDHPDYGTEKETVARSDGVSPAWISISDKDVFNGAPTSTRGDDITEDIPDLLDEVITKNEMLHLVRNRILPFIQGDMVSIHVTFVKKGIRYQANPCFGSEQVGRQHWALVDRTKTVGGRRITDQVGMHLLFIVRVPDLLGDPIEFDAGTSITGAGDYLIAHTLKGPLRETGFGDAYKWKFGTLAEQNQRLIHVSMKMKEEDGSNAICAVPIDLVSGPLVGLNHPGAEHTKKANHEYYYFIVGQDRWADMFIDCAKKEIVLTDEEEEEWTAFLRKYNVMTEEDDEALDSREDSRSNRRNGSLRSGDRRSSTPSVTSRVTQRSQETAGSSVSRSIQETPNSTRTEDSGITIASRNTRMQSRRSSVAARGGVGSETPNSECTVNSTITIASRNTRRASRMNSSTPNSTNTENTTITIESRNTRMAARAAAANTRNSTRTNRRQRINNDDLHDSDDTSSGVSSDHENERPK